ncbi:MAG: RloB family protein [Pirellulales bacterium]
MSPRGKNQWQRSRTRRLQRRPLRKRILIVCEGRQTEHNYFDQLKRTGYARDHLAITVKCGKGGSREQITQFAIDRKRESREPYDEVWCVMDTEEPSGREACETALKTLADNGIEPCLSNPAFEVWFLPHFQKTTQPYLNCDAVVRDLKPHWKKHFSRDYDKAEPGIFKLLCPLLETAMANARWAREMHHSNRPILTATL